MSTIMRGIRYSAICLVTCTVLLTGMTKTPGITNKGQMVVAPATLDGRVTISMSPGKRLTFITCTPNQRTFWQRHLHSPLSCAFVIQHNGPARTALTHAGIAHIEFQSDLLSVAFADSSRYVFSIRPMDAIPTGQGEVDEAMGIATYGVRGLGTHADFVNSRDWTEHNTVASME